jgi:hypothetical protein
MKNRISGIFKLLPYLFIVISLHAQVEFPGNIEIIGAEEIVFDHSVNAIEDEDIPDAPARAFRDADGKIQLIASHYISYRMIGNDFNSLLKDSSVIMNSHFNTDPSKYNSNEWIRGIYTLDGATIHTIIHNEYLPYGAANYETDYFNSLTYGVSIDTGRTYTHATPPDHFVATIPYQYTSGHPMGIFNGSNIIYNSDDGYYYRLVHLEEHLLQDWGVGVIRTQTLSDPDSWRGWNGSAYDVEFVDPYNENIGTRADHILAPVSRDNIGKMSDGLVYSTYFDKYVLVGPHVKYDPHEDQDITGFYYSVSDDLINWSSPILIRETTEGWGVGGEWYPTLIDHNDTTRNFEEIGQEAYLYFTRWNSGNYDRDLLRIPIRFNKNIVSSFTVNSIGDGEGKNTGDGSAYTGLTNTASDPEITLRSAMLEVLSSPDPDYVFTINFDIPGDGPHIIPVGYFLPEMNRPVIIDGYSQPGASENTLSFEVGNNAVIKIELDGSGSGGSEGLAFQAGGATVRGLALHSFGSGIGIPNAGGTRVEGCFIGINTSGTAVGDDIGITIIGSSDNRIGGNTDQPENQNIITGEIIITGLEASGNIIQGNYIGTDVSGASTEGSGTVSIREGASENRIDHNCISGTYRGIEIRGSSTHANVIVNNYLGTDKTGSIGLASGLIGVYLSDGCYDNKIGKPDSSNVIASWTVSGVAIEDNGTSNNLLQGNYIGTNAIGDTSMGNAHPAVYIFNGASDNMIGGIAEGEGNVIAYNTGDAIFMDVDAGSGNAIFNNMIFNNGFGIDLAPDGVNSNDLFDTDSGPNNGQNAPELSSVQISSGNVQILGVLKSASNTNFYVEFFENPSFDEDGYAQGKRRIHTKNITTGSDGYADINITLSDSLTPGYYLTATQTDPDNNTSEFSNAVIILSDVDFPDIAVSQIAVNFPSINPTQMLDANIDIENQGTLSLTWNVVKDAPWIRLDQEGGTLASGGVTILNITVDPQGMISGTHEGNITITSNDPDQAEIIITVSMTINGDADIDVSPTIYDVTYQSGTFHTDTLLITNTGTTLLESYFHSSSEWIQFIPTWKQTQAGETDTIHLSIDTEGLTPDEYDEWLRVDHNVPGIQSVDISFHIQIIIDGPYFHITPDSLYTLMDINTDTTRYCIIDNPGTDTLTWNADSDSTWLVASPLSGEIAPGSFDTLFTYINMIGRDAGLYTSQIDITTNDTLHSNVRIPVVVQVIEPGGTIEVTPGSYTVYLPPGGIWSDSLHIVNSGDHALTWDIQHSLPWLAFSDTAGELLPDLGIFIEIMIDADTLSIGVYDELFTIYSNDPEHAAIQIPIELHITNDPDIRVVPDSIHIFLPPDQFGITQFRIYNDGLSNLNCQVGNDFASNWLNPSPRDPTPIAPGAWVDIIVNINGSVLSLGDHPGTCYVLASNDPDEYETLIPILVTISNDVPSPAIHINTPQNDSIITSDTVSVTFSVENFVVAAPDSGNGYVKFQLDSAPSGVKYNITPLRLTGVSEGEHTLRMWLVTNAGTDVLPLTADTCYFSVDIPVVPAIGSNGIPEVYALLPNYPNPFNPSTTLLYEIPEAAEVSIAIYDILGRKIMQWDEIQKTAGCYGIHWDGTNYSGKIANSGVYIYRMKTGDFLASRKMLFLK